MNKTLILTIKAATTFHRVMRELDTIGAKLTATFDGGSIVESTEGDVGVFALGVAEWYKTRAAFVTAYGLDL